MKKRFRERACVRWCGWIGAVAVLAVMAAPAHAEKAHGPPPKDIKEPPNPVFETSCPDLSGCFWTQASYGGSRFVAGTAYAGSLVQPERLRPVLEKPVREPPNPVRRVRRRRELQDRRLLERG